MNNQSSGEQAAYFDRNQAVLLAATMAFDLGYDVGVGLDPDEPDWPVMYIELPTGQVSWHFPKDELLGVWPVAKQPWDGHSVEDKRARITQFVESLMNGAPALPLYEE